MTKPAESVRLPNGMTPIATEYITIECRGRGSALEELAVCRLETGHLAVAIPKGWIWKGITLYMLTENDTLEDFLEKCRAQSKALYLTVLYEHGLLKGDTND